MEGKGPHPDRAQLPVEHARALYFCVTLRRDKRKETRIVTGDPEGWGFDTK